jgi:alpha-beta hydrolase superfamily lysophospholipase
MKTKRWLWRAVKAGAVVAVTIVGVRAFDARSMPALKVWHREAPPSELRAGEIDGMTLAQYRQREDAVFREVREMESRVPPADRSLANRYFAGSFVNPSRFPQNWNRTFEVVPEQIRGGALLVHGLTDSPYSVRPLAEMLRRQGFYGLCLRMPGHGTVPAGLAQADWQDWLAAVRLGVRHVRGRIGAGKPLVLVGYSNGGALVVKYSVDALADDKLPRADRLVLLSPMIGVTRFAKLGRLAGFLGTLPGLERAKWTDVTPEYNPFKYNSFPAHAARQGYELTSVLDEGLEAAAKTDRIRALPPILTFQSLADATVITQALVSRLYDRLSAGGSELVLFDLNRLAYLRPLLSSSLDGWLGQQFQGPARRYTLSLLTNAGAGTGEVGVRSRAAGSTQLSFRRLPFSWPEQIYSLSHVAVPFPPTDPVYGIKPKPRKLYSLGALAPRGERGILSLPVESLMRMSCNPFFPYMEARVVEWVGGRP